MLERAARLEPGKASILEALGRAYFNSGQHDRARETFEALLEIDPSSHYAQFALGQSLKKLGREREAWVHLRLAVALSPGTPLYRQALARVPDPKAARRGRLAPPADRRRISAPRSSSAATRRPAGSRATRTGGARRGSRPRR